MVIKVARRYARALFELGQESKKTAVIRSNLSYLLDVIKTSPEFDLFLTNPTLAQSKRANVIDLILARGFDEMTCRFIHFLDHKNRLDELKNVCEAFEEYCLDSDGVQKVIITTSSPLSEAQVAELTQHLSRKFGQTVKPHSRIDSKTIGGVKIQCKDQVFDFTFSAQLERFRKELMRA